MNRHGVQAYQIGGLTVDFFFVFIEEEDRARGCSHEL